MFHFQLEKIEKQNKNKGRKETEQQVTNTNRNENFWVHLLIFLVRQEEQNKRRNINIENFEEGTHLYQQLV